MNIAYYVYEEEAYSRKNLVFHSFILYSTLYSERITSHHHLGSHHVTRFDCDVHCDGKGCKEGASHYTLLILTFFLVLVFLYGYCVLCFHFDLQFQEDNGKRAQGMDSPFILRRLFILVIRFL